MPQSTHSSSVTRAIPASKASSTSTATEFTEQKVAQPRSGVVRKQGLEDRKHDPVIAASTVRSTRASDADADHTTAPVASVYIRGSTRNQAALEKTDPFVSNQLLLTAVKRSVESKASTTDRRPNTASRPKTGDSQRVAATVRAGVTCPPGRLVSKQPVKSHAITLPSSNSKSTAVVAPSAGTQSKVKLSAVTSTALRVDWQPYGQMRINEIMAKLQGQQSAAANEMHVAVQEVQQLASVDHLSATISTGAPASDGVDALHGTSSAETGGAAAASSGRLQRFLTAREQRHTTARLKYDEVKSSLTTQHLASTEGLVQAATARLDQLDGCLSQLEQQLASAEVLRASDAAQLQSLIAQYDDAITARAGTVSSLINQATALQERHMEGLRDLLRQLIRTQTDIGHRIASEIEADLAPEAADINTVLIRNMGAIRDLELRLQHELDGVQLRVQAARLAGKALWRKERSDREISLFLDEQAQPDLLDPPARKETCVEAQAITLQLNDQSLKTVSAACSIVPLCTGAFSNDMSTVTMPDKWSSASLITLATQIKQLAAQQQDVKEHCVSVLLQLEAEALSASEQSLNAVVQNLMAIHHEVIDQENSAPATTSATATAISILPPASAPAASEPAARAVVSHAPQTTRALLLQRVDDQCRSVLKQQHDKLQAVVKLLEAQFQVGTHASCIVLRKSHGPMIH